MLQQDTLAVALYVRQLYTLRIVCARRNTTADHERYVAFCDKRKSTVWGPLPLKHLENLRDRSKYVDRIKWSTIDGATIRIIKFTPYRSCRNSAG